jgi:hypothetical protein
MPARKSEMTLTLRGLLMNAIGGVLLLVCHFPFSLPSGESALLAESVPWDEFWKWANAIGSVIGLALTVVGIGFQYSAVRRSTTCDKAES